MKVVIPREQAEGGLQRFDHGGFEPAAFQANAVGAEDANLALAHGGGVRQHVLNDHAVGAHEGVAADAAELVAWTFKRRAGTGLFAIQRALARSYSGSTLR